MDTFEYSGEWWDLRDPATRWIGTLRFDHVEGAVLTVTDPTQEIPAGQAIAEAFGRTLREYDAILGETTAGKAITLLRCFDKSAGAGGWPARPRSRKIFANAVLVGFHGDGRDPLVSGASAVFRHANVWWNQSGITVDPPVKWPDTSVQYKPPSPVDVFADGDLQIKIYATLASLSFRADPSGEYTLREEVRVELTSKTPRPFSVVEEMIHACQDLLSIACQQYCDMERLTLIEPVAERPQTATFHAIPVFTNRGEPRNLHFSDLLFTFTDIRDNADKIFDAWLTNAAVLRPVRALYFSAVYSPNYLEGRFLAFVQGAEGFHRRLRGGVYMDPTAYEEAVASLISAIPTTLESSHRMALRSRLKYGNEYSLFKRLTLLFVEHEMALEKIVPKAGHLVEPIVTRRNELTHFPPDSPSTPIDIEECLRHNFVLRLLLEFCFLKTMGFSDDEISKLVERRDQYRLWVERLFGSGNQP